MSLPVPLTQNPWGFLELLGQRRLWGFGALLAWMVLFHLLVNIWLLCMFTSLVVVLGGWLGYQAILDANTVLHLEHFISMRRVPHSPDSEMQLDREIQSTIRKIIRDFVSSWYRSVSSEEEFELEVQRAMVAVAQGLKARALKVDRKSLTQRLLDLCGCHLQSYIGAKEVLAEQEKQLVGDVGKDDRCLESCLWKVYRQACRAHPAMESAAAELNYTRAIVDLLMHVLVPPPHLETRTGRFVVGELITCNVLLPLIAKMSDPDWLNLLIIDIFAKSSKQAAEDVEISEAPPPPQITVRSQQEKVMNVPCSLNLAVQPVIPVLTATPPPELAAYEVIDPAELYFQPDQEEGVRQEGMANQGKPGRASTLDSLRPDMFNPFYQESDSDQESPLSDFRKSSMESLVLIGPEEGMADRLYEYSSGIADQDEEQLSCPGLAQGCCPKVLVTEDLHPPENRASMSGAKGERKCSWGNIYQDGLSGKESETFRQADRGYMNEFSIENSPQATGPISGGAPQASFSFEPPASPEGPVVIQNLRISGTITAKEHKGSSSHQYTLYKVEYETTVEAENPGTFHPVAFHLVNRRYSEFLNLQTRLEEKPDLRKAIKNVKGPKKPFPDLSFGNTDIDKVGARKGQLETFLRHLCAIPETANSEELQEFLALNTDARIAFVKKPLVVSRIDKIVVNAIVDTLKTAFPRSEPPSPTEEQEGEPEGKPQSDGRKTKSRLRFSSKVSPALNVSELQPQVQYCFSEGNTVFRGLSPTVLESFLKEQVQGCGRARGVQEEAQTRENVVISACLGTKVKESAAETALADVAL
ncbi:hypothetical protein GJAV_G00128320, partial [Gymnothorax javanicus]